MGPPRAVIKVRTSLWLWPSSLRHPPRCGADRGTRDCSRLRLILNAQFDRADAQLKQACPPAPVEACQSLRVVSLWWQILINPESRADDKRFQDLAMRAIEANEAWTRREPHRAEAWFYLAGSLRAAGPVAHPEKRTRRGRARGRRDQGRARARARARPGAERRVLRDRALSLLRGRRAGGRQDPPVAALSSRRRSREGPAGNAAGARPRRAAARRSRLPASAHLSVANTRPISRSRCSTSWTRATPNNPLFRQ